MLTQVRAVFGGTVPKVFARMHAAGALARHWPGIHCVLTQPEPLSPAVVQALFSVFSLRCSNAYCFVLHSLSLLAGALEAPEDPERITAGKLEIAELARVFDMPALEPENERWSQLLKLAWLAHFDGPQRQSADFLLARLCSKAEYEQIAAVHAANAAINSYTVAPSSLDLVDEPMLAIFPPELRALVPDFIRFHMDTDNGKSEPRPVSTMCSICRSLRDTDERWYPYEVAAKLLPQDVLFSHGLCRSCLDAQQVPLS